jgi:heme exporter protein B
MMIATGFRQALAILSKDLWIEGTSWVRWLGLVSFGILVLLLFSFAVGPNSVMLQKHAAGYLWLATLFASANLFTQSFLLETEGGALEQLQLAPVYPAALFYGKAMANTLQLLLVMVVMVPPLIALCDVWFVEGIGLFIGTMVLGALGLSAPGAMYAAMTARLSNQQLLLPLLLFPLIVPALLSAVKATSLIFFGDPMGQVGSWLTLLAAFDVVYWILCGMVFGRIVES